MIKILIMTLRAPPVYLTGIRSGEHIVATTKSKQNTGSELVIYGEYPPSQRALNELSENDWPSLIAFLSALPYFATFSAKQIKAWLLSHATDKDDLYLDDLELQVKPIALSGSLFIGSLSDEDRNKFLSPNPDSEDGRWPLSDLYYAIKPKRVNSKARHHTLVFRPSIWTVKQTSVPTLSKHQGLYFDLCNSTLARGKTQGKILPLKGLLPVLLPTSGLGSPPSIKALLKLACRLSASRQEAPVESKVSLKDALIIQSLIDWAPPSFHKSLIQKIIRTGATRVGHDGLLYDAGLVLLVSFSLLLLHPGAFVPHLQIFVSGAEGALKRLGVTIAEDSSVKDPNGLLSLFVAAWLAKNYRGDFWQWVSMEMIESWMVLALEARTRRRMYSYKTKELAPLKSCTLSNGTAYYFSYLILEDLKSFYGDINLLSWMAEQNGALSTYRAQCFVEVMPLVHAVDQHVWPELAYYCPWSLVAECDELGSDFSPLFIRIWRESSGVNPRKENYEGYHQTMEDNEFITGLRRGQRLLFLAKSASPTRTELKEYVPLEIADHPSEPLYTEEYKLEDSWVAGLIGPISVKVERRNFYVSVDPNDISQRKVMLQPSRTLKSTSPVSISHEERTEAIAEFDKRLKQGVKAVSLSTIPWFNKATIYYSRQAEDQYSVRFAWKDKEVLWSKARKVRTRLEQALEPETPGIKSSIIWRCQGAAPPMYVVPNGLEKVRSLTQGLEGKVATRLLTFLLGNSSKISMPQIDRLGKGTEYSVRPIDVKVYQYLCKLCCLVPFAIKRDDARSFSILYGPFIYSLRDVVREVISESCGPDDARKTCQRWPGLKPYPKPLRDHQEQITSTIVEKWLTERKAGHIVDIPTGGGKTAIVGEVVRRLSIAREMPSYLIYALPPSAIDSVSRELSSFGLALNLVDGRKSSKALNLELRTRAVNLVRHDELRTKQVSKLLREVIGDAAFILDEFHFALNLTQRTTIALELARTSRFFIAMSGTPIKDQHTNYLIPWLEPTVNFQVTPLNMWTAVAGMLSRRMELPIKVVEIEHEVDLPIRLEAKCNQLLSSGIGLNEVFGICFDVCREEMVRVALDKYRRGDNILLVARHREDQEKMEKELLRGGISSEELALITSDNSLTLEGDDDGPVRIVITTFRHSTGYTLSKMNLMITSVYFTNEGVRRQLVGRLVRLSQKAKKVKVVTVHCGILTEVLRRYQEVGSMAAAQKSMAEEIVIGGEKK